MYSIAEREKQLGMKNMVCVCVCVSVCVATTVATLYVYVHFRGLQLTIQPIVLQRMLSLSKTS